MIIKFVLRKGKTNWFSLNDFYPILKSSILKTLYYPFGIKWNTCYMMVNTEMWSDLVRSYNDF